MAERRIIVAHPRLLATPGDHSREDGGSSRPQATGAAHRRVHRPGGCDATGWTVGSVQSSAPHSAPIDPHRGAGGDKTGWVRGRRTGRFGVATGKQTQNESRRAQRTPSMRFVTYPLPISDLGQSIVYLRRVANMQRTVGSAQRLSILSDALSDGVRSFEVNLGGPSEAPLDCAVTRLIAGPTCRDTGSVVFYKGQYPLCSVVGLQRRDTGGLFLVWRTISQSYTPTARRGEYAPERRKKTWF